MGVRVSAALLVIVVSTNASALASPIDFASGNFVLLKSVHTDGLVSWNNSWTWSGAPRSATNEPAESQLRLQSDINLFSTSTDPWQLYVQVTGVSTTAGAHWFGSAIDAVTQTGVRLTGLPTEGSLPSFSSAFANESQQLLCCGPTEISTPLDNTPGFRLDRSGDGGLLINTENGSDYGFTSLSTGLRRDDTRPRIFGGGVFALTFEPAVDLLALDWNTIGVGAEYGAGRQYLPDSMAPPVTPPLPPPPDVDPPQPVPEPSAMSLLAGGIAILLAKVRRRSPR